MALALKIGFIFFFFMSSIFFFFFCIMIMIVYVYIEKQCNYEAHLIVSILVELRNYILFPKKIVPKFSSDMLDISIRNSQ